MPDQADRYSTNTPWEKKFGYCRALAKGNIAHVAGTLPMNAEGALHAPGDAYEQARRCFEIATEALRELGFDASHVLRTRMYVSDISMADDFGRAHEEAFGQHPPCATMIEVSGFAVSNALIEVELEASK